MLFLPQKQLDLGARSGCFWAKSNLISTWGQLCFWGGAVVTGPLRRNDQGPGERVSPGPHSGRRWSMFAEIAPAIPGEVLLQTTVSTLSITPIRSSWLPLGTARTWTV